MSRLPLAAVRVVELDAGLAGARCARILGDLGAEVIKVERPSSTPPTDALRFDLDRNKLGCAIDAADERGRAMLLRLARLSQVAVVAFDGAGPSADQLREAKPDLIIASLPPSDGPPALEDVTLGTAAAAGVLVALVKHRRTGESSLVALRGDALAASFRGERALRAPAPPSASDAPCGCYSCGRGTIAVSVSSDEEFAALCRAIGREELVRDPRLSDAPSRSENAAELGRYIEAWTANRSAEEAAQALQEAGVSASPVLTPGDIQRDPHLRRGGFFELIAHPEGEREVPRLPWRFRGTSVHTRLPAPLPGEHNAYVFRDLLRLSDAEISELAGAGVIGKV
ncbi:MAG: CoA transferase [Dehalococcoidia bacterium]|nr:CoA transferase [Dehalococcoidia bacterium]